MYFPGSRACFLRLLMPFVFVPRKGKRGAASTAGEKTVGFSPKEWQLRGCRGDSEHPLLVFFGTVNGTFLLHKRKVGLRERP